MSRRLLAILVLAGALLTGATPAGAFWRGTGTGAGSAQTADMPTGATPVVAVNGRSVTVSFAQNAFADSTVGAVGGSYTVLRYAEGSNTAITPLSACNTPVTGTAATLSCVEANVPYGRWVYRVTPNVDSFTGTQGPPSAVAAVVLNAPVLESVTPANPAAGAANGPITLSWSASSAATGYRVFRRLSGGAYDYAAPLNGATALTGLAYTDATATNGQTYDYVVVAVNASPLGDSVPSNERSAKVITRPPAPAGAVNAVSSTTTPAIAVSWAAVGAAEGYNVYRRTSPGTFNFATPLNGGTPVTGTSFQDKTALAGTSYVYVIRSLIVGAGSVQVESVNSAESGQISCASSYAATIQAASPTNWFRFADTTTNAANTGSTARNGVFTGGVTYGVADALACDLNAAVSFNGSTGALGADASTPAVAGPNTFTIEVWFKTTAAQGKLVGFGNQRSGSSGRYDRHLYIDTAGKLAYGVYVNGPKTIRTAATVTDGAWHMAAAVLGPDGQKLYLDGQLTGSDPLVTTGEDYSGFWRAGYDNLSGWPNNPSNFYFNGALDEFATFSTQLPAATIAAHYAAGRP